MKQHATSSNFSWFANGSGKSSFRLFRYSNHQEHLHTRHQQKKLDTAKDFASFMKSKTKHFSNSINQLTSSQNERHVQH